ncbi:hypothetical protein AVEN_58546-1 [Araneus ventricosus]|uniref:Integrase catalytic domain-containing protein n=1 Tax=Araneus ventricosus TaxID=182803 RepID=A0A4Y2NHT4_ARAVE|nr:hypothetical protein AVEN_58546-1 [Araneus ventricosus]
MILNNLSIFVSKNQQDWDEKLPLFLLAYRSAVHETTGFTPSRILYGRELRLPCDLLFGVLQICLLRLRTRSTIFRNG